VASAKSEKQLASTKNAADVVGFFITASATQIIN